MSNIFSRTPQLNAALIRSKQKKIFQEFDFALTSRTDLVRPFPVLKDHMFIMVEKGTMDAELVDRITHTLKFMEEKVKNVMTKVC
jgi:hypothetical protein